MCLRLEAFLRGDLGSSNVTLHHAIDPFLIDCGYPCAAAQTVGQGARASIPIAGQISDFLLDLEPIIMLGLTLCSCI